MANFSKLKFTDAGRKMLIRAQNNHTLTFTGAKLGSGGLETADDFTKFTDLKSPKMSLPIVKVDDSSSEKISLTFNTSNTSLEEGFVCRELGVFAKLDDGAETLYAYSNAGNDYDYIPNKDTPTDENRLVVDLVVSSSADVTVLVDGSIVYAHMSDLDDRLQVTATAGKPASMDEKGLWVEIKDGLKSILHHWNKTTNSYDTLHPETESAQITDWHSGIMASLASTAQGTVVNAVSTDSVLGKLIKMLLNASGVKYLIDTNGYICFGSLFGGLIIQWGTNTLAIDGGTHSITLPIAISYAVCAQVTMLTNDVPDIVLCPYWTGCTTTIINITTDYETGHSYAGNGSNRVSWLLVAI